MKPSIARLLLLLPATLALPHAVQAAFILPESPEGTQTEFAWWDGFSDPYTEAGLPPEGETVPPLPDGEGNSVNRPEADNTDALLYQTGTSTGFITSTGSIYSFAEPLTFLIHDTPTFETDSVLLQTQSVGAFPDLDSASLFYRESEDGDLKSAGGATAGDGFLLDGGDAYAMWEWDLSAATIFDFFITFDSDGTSMSLQQAQLDTFDTTTDNLGVALRISTNANFSTVGEVNHSLAGESEPRATYRPGDVVELVPEVDPAFDHVFVGWQGDLSGSDVPGVLTIGENPSVRGVFAPKSYDGWADNNVNDIITDPPRDERADIDANPDGDSFGNLLEYALGGAPEARDDAVIRPRLEEDAEDGTPHFVFRRQMAAEDLTYRVQVSTDLVNWNHNGDGTGQTYTEELPDPVFNGDGTETVRVRAAGEAASAETLFFRLEVIHSD